VVVTSECPAGKQYQEVGGMRRLSGLDVPQHLALVSIKAQKVCDLKIGHLAIISEARKLELSKRCIDSGFLCVAF
jgi:hypothetical protein